jgi:hypothetical protein
MLALDRLSVFTRVAGVCFPWQFGEETVGELDRHLE